jgi:hypothetical protein
MEKKVRTAEDLVVSENTPGLVTLDLPSVSHEKMLFFIDSDSFKSLEQALGNQDKTDLPSVPCPESHVKLADDAKNAIEQFRLHFRREEKFFDAMYDVEDGEES